MLKTFEVLNNGGYIKHHNCEGQNHEVVLNDGGYIKHHNCEGQNHEVVDELIKVNPSLINMTDAKGNNASHIAICKGRVQIDIRF
ncbi:ankyrin repeat family protein [Artemisia annua]|uniref:Ankyrin repeat family protein n=1 Tax=Artemisia annua TaxID=35608 RepID=A0A2U1QMS3_ARTAN|nr:ankyrin repeat family protein [Artemisia annua]